jgi:hypothetical protein
MEGLCASVSVDLLCLFVTGYIKWKAFVLLSRLTYCVYLNTLLSWKAFVTLSRLTYCAYLLQVTLTPCCRGRPLCFCLG